MLVIVIVTVGLRRVVCLWSVIVCSCLFGCVCYCYCLVAFVIVIVVVVVVVVVVFVFVVIVVVLVVVFVVIAIIFIVLTGQQHATKKHIVNLLCTHTKKQPQ